jgi:hypothetical protein
MQYYSIDKFVYQSRYKKLAKGTFKVQKMVIRRTFSASTP